MNILVHNYEIDKAESELQKKKLKIFFVLVVLDHTEDWQKGIGIDWHLNPSFPLSLPRVGNLQIFIWLEILRVRHFHGTDQVFTKQLLDFLTNKLSFFMKNIMTKQETIIIRLKSEN